MLEGNLSEYPLRELLTILSGKRETGRLELKPAAGNLYLAKGQLVDARVGSLRGLSAVNVVVTAEATSFTFHRLPVEPECGFNENEQALLAVLIDLDTEEPTPLLPKVELRPLFASLTEADNIDSRPVLPESKPGITPALQRLQAVLERRRSAPRDVAVGFALSAAQQTLRYVQRHNLAFAFVFVLFVVPAIIAITVRLGINNGATELHSVVRGAVSTPKSNEPAAVKPMVDAPTSVSEKPGAELAATAKSTRNDVEKTTNDKQKQIASEKQKSTTPKREEPVAKKAETESELNKNESQTYSIVVTAKIENGRVTEASVTNHKAGLDAYEATAIHLAQQRRFPKDKTGTERIVLTVSK